MSERYILNGRLLGRQTRWWVVTGGAAKSALYCVHNVALDKSCRRCKNEIGA